MLSSFDGLAVRQLRTRRLRSGADDVRDRAGRRDGVRRPDADGHDPLTFDDVISSAWGSKDLIVMPAGGAGRMREDVVERRPRDAGRQGRQRHGRRVFTRLGSDGRPINGSGGRMMVAGYDTAGTPPYDFQWVGGASPAPGRARRRAQVGRRARHPSSASGCASAPGGPRTLPVVGLFRFSDNLNFGGQGIAAMPAGAARPLMGIPSGYCR
jgi:hypothetical protein